jgi:hypothetical protein
VNQLNGTASSTLEGVVESTNERGVCINGAWANLSRFRRVELPPLGTRVRLSLDPKGFLTAVQVLDQPAAAAQPTRDERITRLAVLKAAAAFGASRPDLKSSEVLAIADRWLQWILAD